jgi:integrase
MPLRVIRRKSTGALTIDGTIRYADGTRRRVQIRAQSDDPALAEEEAAALAARLLRDAWHGERRGARSFAEAAASWLNTEPRAAGDKARLGRILRAIGTRSLAEIDQAAVDRVRRRVLDASASPSTVRRGIVTPIRAVMRHAWRRGWCDPPAFEVPREPEGRTRYLLPAEAERLVAAAVPHLQPLLLFLLGTGARLSEALELQWRDLDLGIEFAGARAIFWQTKGGRRRVAAVPPRIALALAALPWRDGAVFRWETKRKGEARGGQAKRIIAYADRGRAGGGQIKTAWKGALSRAGLDAEFTPHDLRHSWASWRYALDRDLLALKREGGWASVAQVERYAHLLPQGHEREIRRFWGLPGDAGATEGRPGRSTA